MPGPDARYGCAVASTAELSARFVANAADQASRSPLNARLSRSIADDADLVSLLHAAPEQQQLPVLLLAAVHSIVLAEPGVELAAWYPTTTDAPRSDDPFPAFAALCRSRRAEIEHLLRTRHTQTNEVGRCALFLPAIALVANEAGPVALIDVGTSAGLNLLLDRYHYSYQPGGDVGSPSGVEIVTGTRGAVPVPAVMPPIAAQRGIDPVPIDLADEDQARWLRACVWADQPDRLRRLDAAISIAIGDPPDVRTAAAADVVEHLQQIAAVGHPVVLNSWVLNYLSPEQQATYVAELDRFGAANELSWVYAEAPALCEGIPFAGPAAKEPRTVLTLTTWRQGRRSVRRLGVAHPHGYWLHWDEG
jgi:hypothetical protein